MIDREGGGWTDLATRSSNDAGDITPDMFGRILDHVRHDTPMPYSGFARACDMPRVLFGSEESVPPASGDCARVHSAIGVGRRRRVD